MACVLTELIVEPYVVFHYVGRWLLCLLAMVMLLGGLTVLGICRIRGVKDSVQKLKKY